MPVRNAWLTPSVGDLSATEEKRVIAAPLQLWPFILGALDKLAQVENWEDFGTASVDDTSQRFAGIIDNISAASGGTMNFISTASHNLINVSGVSGTTVYFIDDSDLPIEAQGASSIYVSVQLQRLSGSSVQQLRMTDQLNRPTNVIYDSQIEDVTKGAFIVPMRDGGATFRLIGIGNTAYMKVDLLGWFS